MQVPFFNYPALFNADADAYQAIFADVGRRGAFIMQRDLAEFEAALAAYCGARHAIGVADGTLGITLALVASGLAPGDEVILPTHTFVATAAAVVHAGGVPVLADIGADHLIDPEDAARRITPRTRFLMPVQLNGRVADMDALELIAERHGLGIVEDAAQALGARYKGRCAGLFGSAGSISFYPSKTLGAFGDAGAVLTNDDGVAAKVRQLRDHGRNPATGEVDFWGHNARLDNLQAALLLHKLRTYDQAIAHRRMLAELYDAGLRDLPGMQLPAAPGSDPARFDIFQNYELQCDRRDALRAHLTAAGIGTLLQWGGKVIHQFPALRLGGRYPNADRLTERSLMLPMNTAVSPAQAQIVIAAIREFHARA
jgi:dTDP-4-amino-4,6-dideoxygalactose transaminase